LIRQIHQNNSFNHKTPPLRIDSLTLTMFLEIKSQHTLARNSKQELLALNRSSRIQPFEKQGFCSSLF